MNLIVKSQLFLSGICTENGEKIGSIRRPKLLGAGKEILDCQGNCICRIEYNGENAICHMAEKDIIISIEYGKEALGKLPPAVAANWVLNEGKQYTLLRNQDTFDIKEGSQKIGGIKKEKGQIFIQSQLDFPLSAALIVIADYMLHEDDQCIV